MTFMIFMIMRYESQLNRNRTFSGARTVNFLLTLLSKSNCMIVFAGAANIFAVCEFKTSTMNISRRSLEQIR